METSFCELKAKEVVNIVDGKRLGHITDLVFETHCGKILGLVVPGEKVVGISLRASKISLFPTKIFAKLAMIPSWLNYTIKTELMF